VWFGESPASENLLQKEAGRVADKGGREGGREETTLTGSGSRRLFFCSQLPGRRRVALPGSSVRGVREERKVGGVGCD